MHIQLEHSHGAAYLALEQSQYFLLWLAVAIIGLSTESSESYAADQDLGNYYYYYFSITRFSFILFSELIWLLYTSIWFKVCHLNCIVIFLQVEYA